MSPSRSDQAMSYLLLFLTHLFPLAGVLFFGWNVQDILLLYWFENLIIGFYNLLKILSSTSAHWLEKLFFAPFFTVHYGGFCAGHLVFLLALTNSGDPFKNEYLPLIADLRWPILSMLVFHGLSFHRDFLSQPEARQQDLGKLMSAPYKHIVAVHLAIIFGGMLATSVARPLPILILLIVGKLLIDLRQEKRQARKPAAPPLTPDAR
ncbi:MAG: DUF6498-containing protein [Verrucomicrobiales bacterium]